MEITLEELLQRLYDSEINISISWFWDAGIDVCIGTKDFAGERWKRTANFDKVSDAVDWLIKTARELYPNSNFAKDFK